MNVKRFIYKKYLILFFFIISLSFGSLNLIAEYNDIYVCDIEYPVDIIEEKAINSPIIKDALPLIPLIHNALPKSVKTINKTFSVYIRTYEPIKISSTSLKNIKNYDIWFIVKDKEGKCLESDSLVAKSIICAAWYVLYLKCNDIFSLKEEVKLPTEERESVKEFYKKLLIEISLQPALMSKIDLLSQRVHSAKDLELLLKLLKEMTRGAKAGIIVGEEIIKRRDDIIIIKLLIEDYQAQDMLVFLNRSSKNIDRFIDILEEAGIIFKTGEIVSSEFNNFVLASFYQLCANEAALTRLESLENVITGTNNKVLQKAYEEAKKDIIRMQNNYLYALSHVRNKNFQQEIKNMVGIGEIIKFTATKAGYLKSGLLSGFLSGCSLGIELGTEYLFDLVNISEAWYIAEFSNLLENYLYHLRNKIMSNNKVNIKDIDEAKILYQIYWYTLYDSCITGQKATGGVLGFLADILAGDKWREAKKTLEEIKNDSFKNAQIHSAPFYFDSQIGYWLINRIWKEPKMNYKDFIEITADVTAYAVVMYFRVIIGGGRTFNFDYYINTRLNKLLKKKGYTLQDYREYDKKISKELDMALRQQNWEKIIKFWSDFIPIFFYKLIFYIFYFPLLEIF